MNLKIMGALFVVFSCGGFGWYLVWVHKKEEQMLRQLLSALDFMECELQYRLTPLPDLCRQAATQSTGPLNQLWLRFAESLESQILPDVSGCMGDALAALPALNGKPREHLIRLGSTLGRFDLDGQVKGLESVRMVCRKDLAALEANRDVQLRSYQTLGLCAGAALAIILM